MSPVSGRSAEANYVNRGLGGLLASLKDSRSIGVQALLDDLYLLAEECGQEDWNGYGAEPVSRDALENAKAFIACLGLDSRDASLGATGEGWVTLQWGPSTKWTLSIAITDNGWLHWAALFGSVREHGTTPFTGTLPTHIAGLIHRACVA
jgi:hypothetical protein